MVSAVSALARGGYVTLLACCRQASIAKTVRDSSLKFMNSHPFFCMDFYKNDIQTHTFKFGLEKYNIDECDNKVVIFHI